MAEQKKKTQFNVKLQVQTHTHTHTRVGMSSYRICVEMNSRRLQQQKANDKENDHVELKCVGMQTQNWIPSLAPARPFKSFPHSLAEYLLTRLIVYL